MIRVFIVATSAVTRSGLEALLRRDGRFEIIGGGSTLSAIELSSLGRRPEVVLMEAPEIRDFLSQFPLREGLPIVLLADDLNRSDLRTALRRGVKAIVGRHSPPREISAALEATAAGLTILGAEHVDTLLPASSNQLETSGASVEPLTTRETQVLGLLAEGAGNKEIAERLKLSEHTVKFHVSSILSKLGAVTRTEAVTRGIQQGLVII
jgi:NarL family two-component system response regulator YdfI